MKVTFDDFSLEDPRFRGSPCRDVLKFYDNSGSASGFLLGSYCGTTHPEVIYSSWKNLYVKFQTDSWVTKKGFRLMVSAVKKGIIVTVYSLQLFNVRTDRLTTLQSLTQWNLYEPLPGVLGNKGTCPLTFLEHGNKRKIKLGTQEQKHILGNREHQNQRNTFREQGTPKSKKYF